MLVSKDTVKVSKIIKELGIPASVKGYRYIGYAVELLVNDISFMDSIMELYEEVATKFDTTTSKVERGIRYAIELGWSRANDEFAKKLFGYSIDSNKGRPTNAELLVTVADYIIMTQEEGASDDK